MKSTNLTAFFLYSMENISSIVFGIFGFAYIAKTFGSTQLGHLATAQALSAMLLFFVHMGMEHIYIREVAKNRECNEIQIAVQFIQILGWIVYSALMISILPAVAGDWEFQFELALILLLTILFGRANTIRLYLQATNQPKLIAAAAIFSRIASILYLYWSVSYSEKYTFSLLYLPLQALVQFVLMYALSIRQRHFKNIFPNFSAAKKLLKESFPLMLSSALFPVFSQADVLIVNSVLSAGDAGIYSAATRLVPQLTFLGQMTAMTFYPTLSRLVSQDKEEYRKLVKDVAVILHLIATIVFVAVAISSKLIIGLLFGSEYYQSSELLAISAASWLFMVPAALYSRMLVMEGLGRFELYKSIIAVVCCLLLHTFLTARYGTSGAAVVLVCSYAIADLLCYAVFKDTRHIFELALGSQVSVLLNPLAAISSAKQTMLKRGG